MPGLGLPRDVRDDATALVELGVPAREGGLDLGDVRAPIREANRLRRFRKNAVLVPGDLPGEREHELAVDPGERDDRDERGTECARDALDRPREEARVEEVGGLDERRLPVGQATEDRLWDDRLGVAVSNPEQLGPAGALPG